MATRGGGRAILGFGFMAVGGVFVWGGLTGRLAPMLAALFEPQDLAISNPNSVGGIAGEIANPSQPPKSVAQGVGQAAGIIAETVP